MYHAMKKNVHPKYHTLTIVMTDGEELVTRSTLDIGRLQLEVDPKCHVAWTKEQHFSKEGRRSRFQDRFGSIGQG